MKDDDTTTNDKHDDAEPSDATDPNETDQIALSDAEKDEVMEEAKERYDQAETAAHDNRERYKAAIAFIGGDQWEPGLKQARAAQFRPVLTMDRIGTHVNQVVNAMRQNKPAIKTHPIDGTGDVKVAEIFDGVIRHIEAVSNAPTAYETAGWCAAAGGFGYARVLTKYNDETSFEQDIIIARVTNPLAILIDPNSKEQDASDAHFAFVVDSLDKKEFKRRYPDVDTSNWGNGETSGGWVDAKNVRTAEYFRVLHVKDTLYRLEDGTSIFQADYKSREIKTPIVKRRKGWRRVVQWFMLGGNAIIDSRKWEGRWIPIVRVVGNEIDQDGDLQYTGLTHRAMDAQRAYNYWVSTVTETVGTQKSAPYIGAAGQFKGFEVQWRGAATNNPAYLEYNIIDINEKPIGPPTRQPPPTVPTGAVEIVRMMADDMHWITGQQDANFGAPSNEQSGRAIIARAQQGDNATYHYVDNIARSVRHIGRICIDLIPKVMDTAGVLRTLGEDGTSQFVKHDPDQKGAMQEQPNEDTGDIERIFNLGIGRYDVEVSVGPNFTTRRLEAVDAMQSLLQSDPDLWKVIGDIYLRNQDWPGAQEMADRIGKMIDPKLKSDPNAPGGDPKAQMEAALGHANQQVQELRIQEHATNAADQADQEIAELKAQLQKAQSDIDSKTISARTSAEASKYTDDTKLEIARLGVMKDEAVAAIQTYGTQIGEIQQVIAALAKWTGAIESGDAPSGPMLPPPPVAPPAVQPMA